MCRLLLNIALAAAFSDAVQATRITGSLVPEIPAPTPYGLELISADDYRRESAALQGETPAPVPRERITQFESLIDAGEESGGAYAPQLTEVMGELAAAHYSRGDYGAAIDAYKRAIHLTRIHSGLYTAAQIPLLEKLIETQLAAADLPRADQLQQYLHRVKQYQQAGGDRDRLTDALVYTEWQRKAYLSGLGGNTYLRLLQMHTVHAGEVRRIETRDSRDPALIPHLYQLLNTDYLLSRYEGEKQAQFQINIRQGRQVGPKTGTLEESKFERLEEHIPRRGRKLLQRIAALEQQRGNTLGLIEAKVALGDWYLWSEWRARALQTYTEAAALIAARADAAVQMQRLFGAPVELPQVPVFRPGREFSPWQPRGRANVSFKVSRYGRAKNIRVLELQPEDSRGARLAVIRLLRDMRFRPRVEQRVAVDTEEVVREYYFDY